MFERLKQKWNISSNFQLLIIFVVFTITGSSTLYVRKGIFDLIGITEATSLWLKVPLYVILIVPIYQVLFVMIATLFGQYKFALRFERKVISRFIPNRK